MLAVLQALLTKSYAMKILPQSLLLSFLIVCLSISVSCSEDEPPIVEDPEGGVLGFWNSATSTGASFSLSVSSVLQETDGVYAGPFFISNNFKPAFGSTNDGSISFRVINDSIFNFFYDDTIPGCTGTFTGEGIINSEGNFFITFTGTDCDGFHNGTIVLKK